MHKRITGFVLCILLMFACLSSVSYGNSMRVNPPREELEKKIEEVARKRGIPSVILKSIARVESVFKQYNPDGTVYTGRSGSIGLMQINNRYGWFDTNRLKYDIDYNIEAGAEVLLMKWDMANSSLPKIGDMNPNILEHWYFALWAYNGWSESNNPNMIPYKYSTWTKKHTFQQLIYMVAEKEYGQKITPIDPNLLPKKGLPSKNMKFDTPKDFHYGDILMYQKGDVVKVDTSNNLRVRKEPGGSVIGSFQSETVLDVIEGPLLKNGYFWYRVKQREGNLEGWVAGNWIVKVKEFQSIDTQEDYTEENKDTQRTNDENYPLNDISGSWAKDYILNLYNLGIITGDSQGKYYPDNYVNREEMCAFISKTFNLDGSDYELTYEDSDTISSWALEYVKAVSKAGFIDGFEDNTFGPQRYLTREEVAVIIARILGDEKINSEISVSDIEGVSPWAVDSVHMVLDKGMMDIKDGGFKPKDYVTRAELSKIIYNLIQYLTYA